MNGRARRFLIATAWVVAVWGALQIAQIPGEEDHLTCGVWGCYPPFQALAAMHVFWAIVLFLPVWLAFDAGRTALRGLGWCLLLPGVIGIGVLIATDLPPWLSHVGESFRHEWPRRIQYCLLTHTDFPVMQLTLAGIISLALSRRRDRGRAPDTELTPSTP